MPSEPNDRSRDPGRGVMRRALGVVFGIVSPVGVAYLLYRWRQRRKAGRSIRVRVDDPALFLAELADRGVSCAVMRWWDEVPTGAAARAATRGDVDVLIEDSVARRVAAVAARCPGGSAVEFRSVTGELGALDGWPYFPPALAASVLASRVRHPAGFDIPAAADRLPLVMFHLCYHKGEASGIPAGCEMSELADARQPRAGTDYAAKLRALAAAEGVSLPSPLTLSAIDAYLAAIGWDLQIDLLTRWPLQSRWICHLAARARLRYEAAAAAMPGLAVFLLRADLDPSLRPRALELIGERFEVVRDGVLDDEQRRRCERLLRGGNWYEQRGRSVAGPVHYAICRERDESRGSDGRAGGSAAGRVDGRRSDPDRIAARILESKRALRDDLRRFTQSTPFPCRHALHGAEDPIEAQHMLDVLFATGGDVARSLAAIAPQAPPQTA